MALLSSITVIPEREDPGKRTRVWFPLKFALPSLLRACQRSRDPRSLSKFQRVLFRRVVQTEEEELELRARMGVRASSSPTFRACTKQENLTVVNPLKGKPNELAFPRKLICLKYSAFESLSAGH